LRAETGSPVSARGRRVCLTEGVEEPGDRGFGTGYSSLSDIRGFSISRIKIDRAFVSSITTNANDAIFTAAVIAMGHTLGLSVVGEGVETQEQADLLASQGCDELQGSLFSRPCPADEFEGLLIQEKTPPES
jgi:EAL domain-containing protein (putative c-di-GMP-specific phosphodiesterase class I)